MSVNQHTAEWIANFWIGFFPNHSETQNELNEVSTFDGIENALHNNHIITPEQRETFFKILVELLTSDREKFCNIGTDYEPDAPLKTALFAAGIKDAGCLFPSKTSLSLWCGNVSTYIGGKFTKVYDKDTGITDAGRHFHAFYKPSVAATTGLDNSKGKELMELLKLLKPN
jgi:hypothetical protein